MAKGNRNVSHAIIIILLFISMLPSTTALSAQVTLDSEDQFGFARYCMEKGEYYRAVGEFERFIYLFPNNDRIPVAHYLIGVCYLMGAKYESARSVLDNVCRMFPESPFAGKALFLIGETYYKEGIFDEAERVFKKVMYDYPDSELRNAALYRLGWSRMAEDQWQEAAQFFKRVDKGSDLYSYSLNLFRESLKGEELPQKSPTTAGIMAAVVPGLGHIYCGRPKDGLMAFLVNGVFILAAVESFEQDHDVLGSILAFLELGWYSGNIYSAVNSAHKYNRKIRNDFRRGLPDRLDLNFFISGEGHLGLVLGVNF